MPTLYCIPVPAVLGVVLVVSGVPVHALLLLAVRVILQPRLLALVLAAPAPVGGRGAVVVHERGAPAVHEDRLVRGHEPLPLLPRHIPRLAQRVPQLALLRVKVSTVFHDFLIIDP